MKIVINSDFGGYGLSNEACNELGMSPAQAHALERNDPRLVACVEKLGDDANSRWSKLAIVEIPDDATTWYISEFDGSEHIAEGRTWGAE